jgi:hypothetical protein
MLSSLQPSPHPADTPRRGCGSPIVERSASRLSSVP